MTKYMLHIGDLYYWNKKIVCEYIGYDRGLYNFISTNGGIIRIKEKDLVNEITNDELE